MKRKVLALVLVLSLLLCAIPLWQGKTYAAENPNTYIAGGWRHTVALKSDGTVWTWGYNGHGELGDGTTTDRYTPVQVQGLTGITAVASKYYHTVALKSDGTVWTWGYNGYGQLGNGTTINSSTPLKVQGLTGVIAIASGYHHTVALKSDGTVWTWGYNAEGELGDGTTTQRNTPVQVQGLSGISAIAGGGHHTLALKNDGTVWTWGWNNNGQLGDGTTTNKSIPTQVQGLTGVTTIANGYESSRVLKNDGTVWTWGRNDNGQLGDGTTTQRNTPIQVQGLSGMTAIAGGGYYTIALKNDGTVWIWGRNVNGELGDGTTTDRYTPVQVQSLTGVIGIAGGYIHTIALKSDGTVRTWGNNSNCQLGDGTTTDRYTPIQVQGLTSIGIGSTPTPTPTPTQQPTSTPTPAPAVIIPNIITDMEKYIQNDTVQLSLKLTNTQPTDKTNSVTFQVEYDADVFEPITNNVENDITNGYIPHNTKMNLGNGSTKRILVSYVDMDNDITLQQGAKVFTAKFKVKPNPPLGVKTFKLRPVNMYDSSSKIYNVNNGAAVTKTVTITDNAVTEGYVNVYLGDNGTGLNNLALEKLNQDKINETFRNLKFTLKHSSTDTGTVLSGSDVFLPDESGNLAVKDTNNKVTGRFRVFTPDTANTILTIDSAGYLKKDINITSLDTGKVWVMNSASTPVEIYPGDLAGVSNLQFVMQPDGEISNTDFTVWLKTYNDAQASTASADDLMRIDFTKDGIVDNIDFSLWMASFRKVLTLLQ